MASEAAPTRRVKAREAVRAMREHNARSRARVERSIETLRRRAAGRRNGR